MRYGFKFAIGAIVFVAVWALIGSSMERYGVEDYHLYMFVGAILGLIWYCYLTVIDD